MKAFNIKGKILDLSTAKVMGILNITDDSFFDGGAYLNKNKMLEKCGKMLLEGASIIDIGAQSSRPRAKPIDFEVEKERLLIAITNIKHHFPDIIISVDTYDSSIAKSCIKNGADIINDISAGEMDKEMFEVVAKLGVPYIMMHMQGIPENMQENPIYKDVVAEVLNFLRHSVQKAEAVGVRSESIAIDPGIGFGKNLSHNLELIANLSQLKVLNKYILLGVSRKSFIGQILNTETEDRLEGSLAAGVAGVINGANILRVHDVASTVQAVQIAQCIREAKK
mgnify:CR=1 FL=1